VVRNSFWFTATSRSALRPRRRRIDRRHVDSRTIALYRDKDAVVAHRRTPIEQDLKPATRATIPPDHAGRITRGYVPADVVLCHRHCPSAVERNESCRLSSRPQACTAHRGAHTCDDNHRACNGDQLYGRSILSSCHNASGIIWTLEALNGTTLIQVSLHECNNHSQPAPVPPTSRRLSDSALIRSRCCRRK